VWAEKNPVAWARLNASKEELTRVSEERSIPSENLLTPDFLRRLCWEAPEDISASGIREALLDRGARVWQVDIVAQALSEAFRDNSDAEPPSPAHKE
jgi:ribonuclease D